MTIADASRLSTLTRVSVEGSFAPRARSATRRMTKPDAAPSVEGGPAPHAGGTGHGEERVALVRS
jgi:hypothetical protein